MAQKVFIITGQTATGKTSSAIVLAKQSGGDIISADSRQAYAYCDIISGKDIERDDFIVVKKISDISIGYYTIQGIRVWLYDMCTPDKYLSAYDWAKAAKWVISWCKKNNRIPFIVGGTYFYIHSLIHGLDCSAGPDWDLRKQLQGCSVKDLQERLMQINSQEYELMNFSDKHNKRRIIRKIEKLQSSKTKKPIEGIDCCCDIYAIGLLHKNSHELESSISLRVRSRIKKGAFDEVEILQSMGYKPSDPGLSMTGYRELLGFLNGEHSFDKAVEKWITRERQYARRQKTLMKRGKVLTLTESRIESVHDIPKMLY